MWKRQPLTDGKRKYTRADIWNKVFENLGLDITMPQGSIEKGNYAIENSPFKVTRNLSAAGTEVVGVLADLINDNVITLNEPSKEFIDTKNNQKIRSEAGRTIWDYMRPLLDFSAYGK